MQKVSVEKSYIAMKEITVKSSHKKWKNNKKKDKFIIRDSRFLIMPNKPTEKKNGINRKNLP